ncbi:hypothetical protein [Vagococcus sp. WN89Y]|uniref:hypothetical protein n=1 Tax=Vagococcus sp. WN89Y TaxID=3457258 RepID=UPI003FCCC16B
MPAAAAATRHARVYNPYQTLPLASKRSSIVCLLNWIKNSAGCLCRRPPALAASNTLKANLNFYLTQFFMHGKEILALNNNQQSVLDNFQAWIRQHQGEFTREDQQIIKDYSQELRAIIFPTASETQKALLEADIVAIENIANNIFSDVRLVVGKPSAVESEV